MPNRDMTGPRGMGPMTGRGLGYGSGSFGFGRGCKLGGRFHHSGYGFGYGRNADLYFEDIDKEISRRRILENQIKLLKNKLSILETELESINDSLKTEEN